MLLRLKNDVLTWKTIWQFPKKLNKNLPYEPATQALPKNNENVSTERRAHQRSKQHYFEQPKTVNNPNVLQLVNGQNMVYP